MVIQRVLGFDYGEQRIGVAVGQMITRQASPLTTLQAINHKPDWARIEQLIKEWQPDALVVGMPYSQDGSENEMTTKVQRFCRQLMGRFQLPVDTVNENLSSFEAEQRLQAHKKIGQHNKHEIDRMAAAIIVENWLEQHP